MAFLTDQPAYLGGAVQATDVLWIDVDNGDSTFTSYKISGADLVAWLDALYISDGSLKTIQSVSIEGGGNIDIGVLINAATSKTTPVDADEIGISDSAASNVFKKLTWANLKATLKAYFDTIYAVLTGRFGVADATGKYTYYSTLQAAITAASAGQTVEMFTDYTETTNTSIIPKDGVIINGNGHTYTLDNSGTASCFRVTASGTYIFRNLTVKRTGATSLVYNENKCFSIEAANVTIDLTGCRSISSKENFRTLGTFNALRLIGGYFLCGGGYGVNITGTSTSIADNITVEHTGTGGTINDVALVIGSNGTVNNSKILQSGNAYAVYGDGGTLNNSYVRSVGSIGIFGTGSDITVNNCAAYSSGSHAIQAGFVYRSTGYSTAGIGIYITQNGICNLSFGYSSSSIGLYGYTSAKLSNCTGYSTATRGLENYDSGFAYNCTSISTASAAMSSASGLGVTRWSQCVFHSTWNNAGGHGFVVNSNNIVLMNCTFIVTNASANCINAPSAYTTKYTHSDFTGATTSVHANVTQGVAASHDSQGNITI